MGDGAERDRAGYPEAISLGHGAEGGKDPSVSLGVETEVLTIWAGPEWAIVLRIPIRQL